MDNEYDGLTAQLFGKINVELQGYTTTVYPTLMESFDTWFRAFLILYLVFVGWAMITGFFRTSTKEVGLSLLLVVILHSTILESSIYLDSIVIPFMTFNLQLANFFVGMSGNADPAFNNLFASMDNMLSQIFLIIGKIEPTGGLMMYAWVYIQTTIATILFLAVYIVIYVAFLAILLMSIFTIHILFLLGGICIYFASFKETRFVFWQWLRGLMNYSLLIVLISIVMAICMFGLNEALNQLSNSAQDGGAILFSKDFLATIFWGLVTVALLLKTPDVSAMLTGGTAGSTAGIAGGIGAVVGSVVSGGSYMATQFGKKVTGQVTRGVKGVSSRFGDISDLGDTTAHNAYSRSKGIDRT